MKLLYIFSFKKNSLFYCRMLRCGILSLIRSCSIQSSRFYRDRKIYAGDEAGFRHQKREMGDADLFMEDPEGSYEADFSKAPATMREHEREMQRQKEKIKSKIIERKYFRTKKQPSFLTWAEKEQIRHLNQQDPDEWTVQHLSDSFPATEDVIIKILKAKWSPNDMKRIRAHDESVKKNWQAFKAKKLDNLNPDLIEHLAKFSQRKFDSKRNAYVLSKNDQITFKFPKAKRSQEFSHIISSCKPLMKAKEIAENKSKEIEAGEKGNSVMVSETSIEPQVDLPKNLRSRSMTFDELQKKLGIDKVKADEDDFHVGFPKEPNSLKPMDKPSNNNCAVGMEDFEEIDLNYSQYGKKLPENESVSNESNTQIVNLSTAPISKYVSKTGDAESLTIPDDSEPYIDKIVIPSKVKKKGAMYKVNDSFYDDNGDFLFRVPGLDAVYY